MHLPNTKSDMSGRGGPAYTNGRCGAIRSTNFCRYCSSPQKPKTLHPDGTVLSGCSASDTLPDGWMRRSCPSGRQTAPYSPEFEPDIVLIEPQPLLRFSV